MARTRLPRRRASRRPRAGDAVHTSTRVSTRARVGLTRRALGGHGPLEVAQAVAHGRDLRERVPRQTPQGLDVRQARGRVRAGATRRGHRRIAPRRASARNTGERVGVHWTISRRRPRQSGSPLPAGARRKLSRPPWCRNPKQRRLRPLAPARTASDPRASRTHVYDDARARARDAPRDRRASSPRVRAIATVRLSRHARRDRPRTPSLRPRARARARPPRSRAGARFSVLSGFRSGALSRHRTRARPLRRLRRLAAAGQVQDLHGAAADHSGAPARAARRKLLPRWTSRRSRMRWVRRRWTA